MTLPLLMQVAAKHKRPACGYLLCGPVDEGALIAQTFAVALNGGTRDLFTMDARPEFNEDAKDLRERGMHGPPTGSFKVYCVTNADQLTAAAWDALNAILVDPPENVVFVFVTDRPQEIRMAGAPAIGLTQRIDIGVVREADLEQAGQSNMFA